VRRGPRSTLLLLVTCSRDETRRDLAIRVTTNLAELTPTAGLADRFVVFDNGSTLDDHLALVPPGTIVCRSERNLGYWSAIQWVLAHRDHLFGQPFEYLYIVESDLVHRDLVPLGVCERFLESEPRAACVRTQEFSVRLRWRFDKRWQRLPFHVLRSQIVLRNAVTDEKAWFRPAAGLEEVYLSNLHAKLPALNRLDALDRVFGKLSEMASFTERDFFRLMMERHPYVGVYEGGLFWSAVSWANRDRFVMASYTDERHLGRLGYQPTRATRIERAPGEISVRRAGVA